MQNLLTVISICRIHFTENHFTAAGCSCCIISIDLYLDFYCFHAKWILQNVISAIRIGTNVHVQSNDRNSIRKIHKRNLIFRNQIVRIEIDCTESISLIHIRYTYTYISIKKCKYRKLKFFITFISYRMHRTK